MMLKSALTLAQSMHRKGFAAIEPIIRSSHVLMPNAFELELLTGETDYRKGADLMIEVGR